MCSLRTAVGASAVAITLSIPAHASTQWETASSTDEMTGEKRCFAVSPTVPSTREMKFPYTGTTAYLAVAADGNTEWVAFGFSGSPNITGDTTENGYNRIRTRIKWDDEVEDVVLIQEWGASSIHFRDDKAAISRIIRSGAILLELNWHSAGKTYFRIPLAGAAEAIDAMRASCGEH